jgi:hypothetical protein
VVKEGVLKEDTNRWFKQPPRYMITAEKAERQHAPNGNVPGLRGETDSVLQQLFAHTEKVQKTMLTKLYNLKPRDVDHWDPDLTRPYEQAAKLGQMLHLLGVEGDLLVIDNYVAACFDDFKSQAGHNVSDNPDRPPSKVEKSAKNARFAAITQKFAEPIRELCVLNRWPFQEDEIKASAAVRLMKHKQSTSKFPFSVAFAVLCRIKARAVSERDVQESQNPLSILPSIASAMSMPSSIVRGLRVQYELANSNSEW